MVSCGSPSPTPPPTPETTGGDTGSDTASTSTSSTTSPIGRAPTNREAAAINRLERQATRLRQLGFVRPVDSRIHSQEEIRQFLHEQMNDDSLERGVRVYVGLGMLPSDIDVGMMVERVLSEQVVGYYDPDSHRLVVRADAARSLRTHTIGAHNPIRGDSRYCTS